jgi:Mn2+/Fe2+ NRAMP family transporter
MCPPGGITAELAFLVVGIVGTTIAPWQLFFQQSCVADNRLRFKDLKWARLDTFLGGVFTVIVGGCMMLAGNAAKVHGLEFLDPAELAVDIGSIFGPFVKYVILFLMINAAVLGTTAVSLASSWAYGEVRGWPHSLQLPLKEAPGFYLAPGCAGDASRLISDFWSFLMVCLNRNSKPRRGNMADYEKPTALRKSIDPDLVVHPLDDLRRRNAKRTTWRP